MYYTFPFTILLDIDLSSCGRGGGGKSRGNRRQAEGGGGGGEKIL